jgi:hypothetical protein
MEIQKITTDDKFDVVQKIKDIAVRRIKVPVVVKGIHQNILDSLSFTEDMKSYQDGSPEKILAANTVEECLDVFMHTYYHEIDVPTHGAKFWAMEKAIGLAESEDDFKLIFETNIIEYENLAAMAIRKFADFLFTEKIRANS